MSDVPVQTPAPRAPLVTVLAVFVLFFFFLVAVWLIYLPRDTGPVPDDGIHTAAQRKENLAKLRAKHAEQLASYGWVDQKAGIVQLPIERAMELTIQKYAKKQ